jgi:hypothetical protein
MRIYWFKLRKGLRSQLGFGITARNWSDAILLLGKASNVVGESQPDEVMIETWKEVTSIDDLDQNHVVPNMGLMLRRGVWFPNLPDVQ